MKSRKNIVSKILLGIGIVLLTCYLGGLFYIYNIYEYDPYGSIGADMDALFHSIFFLSPSAICLILSFILYVKAKQQ